MILPNWWTGRLDGYIYAQEFLRKKNLANVATLKKHLTNHPTNHLTNHLTNYPTNHPFHPPCHPPLHRPAILRLPAHNNHGWQANVHESWTRNLSRQTNAAPISPWSLGVHTICEYNFYPTFFSEKEIGGNLQNRGETCLFSPWPSFLSESFFIQILAPEIIICIRCFWKKNMGLKSSAKKTQSAKSPDCGCYWVDCNWRCVEIVPYQCDLNRIQWVDSLTTHPPKKMPSRTYPWCLWYNITGFHQKNKLNTQIPHQFVQSFSSTPFEMWEIWPLSCRIFSKSNIPKQFLHLESLHPASVSDEFCGKVSSHQFSFSVSCFKQKHIIYVAFLTPSS